jgi:hypothetical protein
MSAPGPKDRAAGSPPAPDPNAHEVFLPGDDDPLVILPADGKPIPAVIDDRAAGTPAAGRAQAEYTTEQPSIAPDRVREPVEFPWATPGPAAPRRRRSPWARRAVLIVGGAAIAFAAWAGVSALRPHPPVIASIMPAKAEPGQTVTIAGTALGTDPAAIVVRFGDRRGPVTSANGGTVAATVPADLANAPASDMRVIVEVDGRPSNALFMRLARYPRISSVEPAVALPGTEVLVKGVHLEGDAPAVRIGGFPATLVSAGRDGLRVRVPEMPVVEGKTVPVDVMLGRDAAKPGSLLIGHLPLVTRIAPSSGEVGTRVTISGYGFAPGLAANRVTFGSLEAIVLSATDREIQAAVPAAGILGSRTVLPAVVAVGGAQSAPVEFTAVRPSGEVYRPHFAATAAPNGDPERTAVVATEIGPVLVLSGRGDAASPGERAARVATQLNTLLQASASRPVRIDMQDAPPRVIAEGATIVTVGPEDAEGMARGWDGLPGARVTPPVLARYWAALLNDYIGLFGQRARPNRIIELTPRGRVLLDLYADAERRGGSTGVGMTIVSTLSPDRADSLRRLGYSGPEAGRSSGLALAGGWEGHIDDGGPPRAIRVDVTLEGDRLAGAMKSSAGDVAMGIPLRDLSYDKGMVRFSAVLGGAPRHFEGTLDGATLTGTVQSAGAGAPAARFTLRHVE